MEKSNIEKVKDYVAKVLKYALEFDKTKQERIASRNRAFGAIHFSVEIGFITYEEIKDWWENEMHPKFTSNLTENEVFHLLANL